MHTEHYQSKHANVSALLPISMNCSHTSKSLGRRVQIGRPIDRPAVPVDWLNGECSPPDSGDSLHVLRKLGQATTSRYVTREFDEFHEWHFVSYQPSCSSHANVWFTVCVTESAAVTDVALFLDLCE